MGRGYKIFLALLVLWVICVLTMFFNALVVEAAVNPSRASLKQHDCMSLAGTYAVVHSMLLLGASDKKALSVAYSDEQQQDDVEGMKGLVDWLRTVPKRSHGEMMRAVYKDCMKVEM